MEPSAANPLQFTLSNVSMLLGVIIGAYTLLTALIAFVTSYALVKFRLKKLEEDRADIRSDIKEMNKGLTGAVKDLERYVKGVLFQPDTGETILMPRASCAVEREKCQSTMDAGFSRLSKDLKAMDEKREESKSALLALFGKLNETIIALQAEMKAYKEAVQHDNKG